MSAKSKSLTEFSLVLDLDETLLHTYTNKSKNKILKLLKDPLYIEEKYRFYELNLIDPVSNAGDGEEYACWGTFRPDLDIFLTFSKKYFKNVNIWTAGKRVYAHDIATTIQENVSDISFNVIYTYDECKDQENCTYKDLKKMSKYNPEIGTMDKIFVIDDKEESYELNPDNGILIPPYSPEPNVKEFIEKDNTFKDLIKFFQSEEVMGSSDVRTIDKSNIF
jgi:TFIIF-interacting CTD phosphatase-like protein